MDENVAPKKSNMMPIIIGVIVLLLLAGGAWYFMSQQGKNNAAMTANPTPTAMEESIDMTETPTDSSPSGTVTPSGAMVESGSTKTITVSGGNFFFTPKTLTVNKGDTVKVVFKNSGGTHNFVIDEFDVETKTIQGGAEDTVEFVADKAGTYEFYCSVGQHRQMGMKGTLTVK
jgi:nitrosocyanin